MLFGLESFFLFLFGESEGFEPRGFLGGCFADLLMVGGVFGLTRAGGGGGSDGLGVLFGCGGRWCFITRQIDH